MSRFVCMYSGHVLLNYISKLDIEKEIFEGGVSLEVNIPSI